MHALIWLLSGLLAGWLAQFLMKGPRLGFAGDFTLGALGSVLGTWLLTAAGGRVPDAVSITHLGVAALGAMVLVGLSRVITGLATRARHHTHEVGRADHAPDLEAMLVRLGDAEKRVLEAVIHRQTVARDAGRSFAEQLTFGQRVADRVAVFGGSWKFLGLFAVFMLGWMLLNSAEHQPFDPFPFILLNLILSCLAAIQAPVIMMSQNRQSATDRLHAQQDYEVNLKAEMEVMSLHVKLDEARERELRTLLDHQSHLLEALSSIDRRLARVEAGLDSGSTRETAMS